MSELVAYVDGGSHGNPGPAGIGVVIESPNGEKIRIAKWIGHHDNNVAEYTALLEALQYVLELKAKALHVFSDSEVVVRQMKGEYACRSPRLYSLNWICQKLARSLQFSIAHIPRQDNERLIVWLTQPSEDDSRPAISNSRDPFLSPAPFFYRIVELGDSVMSNHHSVCSTARGS
jgi:ribonuclease HI